LDFDTTLVEKVMKVHGANYYSVKSASDFKKRLDEEFEYLVTPLVFDLSLKFDAVGYEIEKVFYLLSLMHFNLNKNKKKVFGSPEADAATGVLMKVGTMFPSPQDEEGRAKGIFYLFFCSSFFLYDI
jgi:Ca-activated chloride channel homolog